MRRGRKKKPLKHSALEGNQGERVEDGWAAKVTTLPDKQKASFRREFHPLVNLRLVANGIGSNCIIESRGVSPMLDLAGKMFAMIQVLVYLSIKFRTPSGMVQWTNNGQAY